MDSPLIKVLERFLYGTDRQSSARRDSVAALGGSDNTVSAPDFEKSTLTAEEKNGSNVTAAAFSPVSSVEQNPQSPRKESWPRLFKSPTLYSLPSTLPKLWSRKLDCQPSWEPSPFRLRPLAGLCALALAICCVFASLAILIVSDGQPTDQWPIQPTVYLAIVAAIANSAIRVARAEAISVSWWYRASRGGTVRALERQWEVSQSLVRAILHSRHMSLLNVACVAISLVIIDGPLLQRASSVVPATLTKDINLNLVLPPELPRGFSGYFHHDQIWISNDFWYESDYWMRGLPMPFNAPECTGLCQATVQGPAVAKGNCTSKTWPITPNMTHSLNASWGTWKGFYELHGRRTANNPAFYVDLAIDPPPSTVPPGAMRQSASLTVGLLNWSDLRGSYIQTKCNLFSAIGEYNVVIQNGTIAFASNSNQGRVVRLANNSPSVNLFKPNVKQWDTLDEVTQWLGTFVNANGTVSLGADGGPNEIYGVNEPSFTPQVARYLNFSAESSQDATVDLSFLDPTPDIILKYNQLMFRGAVYAVSNAASSVNFPSGNINQLLDAGLSVNQTVRASQSVKKNVFHTDLRWYAGAAVLEFVTVLLILPMSWGWWTLGKDLTFSPFSIALAFDSPLLRDVNSATGAKGVVRELGGMELKFGMVGHDDSIVDEGDSDAHQATGRLGIAESKNVVRPRNGMRFKN